MSSATNRNRLRHQFYQGSMTTTTAAVFPIARALSRGREFAKAESEWTARGPNAATQERYIPLLATLAEQFRLFNSDELKAIASDDHEVINFWLKKNGFNIELQPFSEPNDFGTASIMSVLVKWVQPGERTKLLGPCDVAYDAVRLEDNISFSKVEGREDAIVHLETQNGDVVHLMVADVPGLEGLDLLEKVQALTGERSYDYGGVTFPMVDLDQEVDISFFQEMGFMGTGAKGDKGFIKIKEALQQTKFKMNHLGAKAESAAAFGFTLECAYMPKPDLVINKPFYVWMTRPGMSVPYFAGYLDTSDWKDPGEIK